MKKYIKPELFFESFNLSQQITAACAWDMTNQWDAENCYAKYNPSFGLSEEMSGLLVFSNGLCNSQDPGIYCTTNGLETNMVFNS